MMFPKWLPYTVGLLIFAFAVGVTSHVSRLAPDCPMHALVYSGNDGVVDESEWNAFICVGCHPESFCIQEGRTCGDGSTTPESCRWTFNELNKEITRTSIAVETFTDATGPFVLTADELQQPACNSISDVLAPLASIDPHVMLVVFLPVLLFESAFLGIDVSCPAALSAHAFLRTAPSVELFARTRP